MSRLRFGLCALERAAARVVCDDDFAGVALERGVLENLDAREPRVVQADEAEHVRRERSVRVVTLRLLDHPDALQAERTELRSLFGLQLAREPDELVTRSLLSAQSRFERRGGSPDERRERLRRRALVLDEIQIGEERINVEAARELAPLPIEDETARAVRRVLRLLLTPRAIRQELVLENLQLHEPQADDEHPEDDAEDDDRGALPRAVGSESGSRVRHGRHS
jgi:hypothetical protein